MIEGQSFFDTAVDIVQTAGGGKGKDDENIFSDGDIQVVLQKKLHNDYITWIEEISQYNCIATASFDCCCHIWNISDLSKMGSLILGSDHINNGWMLKINQQKKMEELVQVANDLFRRLPFVEFKEAKKPLQSKIDKNDY